MIARDTREYYLAFISLVFGIFITVWAQPLVELIKDQHQDIPKVKGTNDTTAAQSPQGTNPNNSSSSGPYSAADNVAAGSTNSGKSHASVKEIFARLTVPQRLQGILTLFVIVCLWWWYGIFLRTFSPAEGFIMYFFDFSSLATFAVAAGIWRDETGCFAGAVIIACALIFFRFFFALEKTKRCPRAYSVLRIATFIVAGMFLAGCIYNFGRGSFTDDAGLNLALIVIMGVSVIITIIAFFQTEGLGWGRPFVYEPAFDKLIDPFLDPLSGWTAPHAAVVESRCRFAMGEFDKQATECGLTRTGSNVSSAVHSSQDLFSQVKLAVYATDDVHDDLSRRVQIMCFVHWFDDFMDQDEKRARALCGKASLDYDEIFKVSRFSYDRVRMSSAKKLCDYYGKMYPEATRKNFDIGLRRIVYGARLFRETDDRVFRKLREKHIDSLKKLGVSAALLESVSDVFIDFTVKTVMEFWSGVDEKTQSADDCFRFSLLYGPGLYYHDCEEEKKTREQLRTIDLDDGDTAKMIKDMGAEIGGTLPSDLKARRRAQEVSHFVLCFGEAMPSVVRKAYEDVVKKLLEVTKNCIG